MTNLNEMKESEKINFFRSYFKKLWQTYMPVGLFFSAENNEFYYYDTGTNKILNCEKSVYEFVNLILYKSYAEKNIDNYIFLKSKHEFIKNATTVYHAIEEENIMKTKPALGFGASKHFFDYENMVKTSLTQLTLEVTERCNMRCTYCSFNTTIPRYKKKKLSNMTKETAFKAIDFFLNHSKNNENITITFYGGEPLLNFDLIKLCVEYVYKNTNQKCSFSLTTNGTLLDQSIIHYLSKIENFNVVVSLDGPKKIHNQYRKMKNGSNSYDQVIMNLKALFHAFQHNKDRISLSMVYTPFWSIQKLNQIVELWDIHEWLPKDVKCHITYPSPGTIEEELWNTNFSIEDASLLNWAQQIYFDAYPHKETLGLIKSIVERPLTMILQRTIYDIPVDKYSLNGCCLPALRKLFINVDGKFHVCERIHEAPSIGNVESGIDIDLVKKQYIDDYASLSISFCSNCWALQLCNICYLQRFQNGQLDPANWNKDCNLTRSMILKHLKYYCRLLKKDSQGLNHLAFVKMR
ncbi:radical SAM protein [Candidatus Peregrinibacteria bacterium]|nr:radical SAM protein [Candidatus Peregrinibacteria bacterium]